jgi:hypothetical protein
MLETGNLKMLQIFLRLDCLNGMFCRLWLDFWDPYFLVAVCMQASAAFSSNDNNGMVHIALPRNSQ